MPDPMIPRRGGTPPRQQPQRRQKRPAGHRSADIARSLGGDPAWVKKVRSDGAGEAVFQWIDAVDKGGGTATLFRLLQQFGHWLEQRTSSGRPPNQGEVEQAIERLAEKYGVDPETAERFVMNALRQVQTAARKIAGPQQRQQQRPQQPQRQAQPPRRQR